MKKIYLLAALVSMGSLTYAQHAVAPWEGFAPAKAIKGQSPHANAATFKAPGDTVFSEDFSNGLPGNNGVGPWTVGGPDGALWMFDTDGPNGDFSSPSEHIASTTWTNGFMIFDSNLSNDGCTDPGGSCITRDGWLISPVLDLSATPSVHLVFQEKYRWCCAGDSPYYVEISSDGGASWPTRVKLEPEVETNDDSGTITTRVNLCEGIAADPSNARFRIVHDGTITGNASHYHWQIDDLVIVESDAHDLALTYAAFDNHIPGQLSDNLPYTIYPMSQVREFTMVGKFNNEGGEETNVKFKSVVYDAGMNMVWSDSSTIATMQGCSNDSIELTGHTPAAMVESYTVEQTLSMDSTDARPDDNFAMHEFAVSEYIYALDEGSRDGAEDNAGDAYQLGNYFWIENDIELTGIQVAVASGADNTDPGALLSGVVFDGNGDLVDVTEDHDILVNELTSMNNAKWITLPFSSPIQLFGGEEYLICMEHFGGADNIAVATSGQSLPQSSLIYNSVLMDWFYVLGTPMVRAYFDPSVGIEDTDIVNGVGLGQNFPNPYSNITSIPYSLDNAADVSLEVYDVTGKLVMTVNEGHRGAGNYRIEMDASDLVSGIYHYTLVANNVRVTKKMTVIE